MKALFLGICLLNLVFFFWEFHKGAVNPLPVVPSNLPTIMLADELENARRGEVISEYLDKDAEKLEQLHAAPIADKPVIDKLVADKPITMPPAEKSKKKPAVPVPAQPPACHEIGPFADPRAANAWLAGQALQGELFRKETSVPAAYQVYYPAAKSPEQAQSQKAMLNAKGVTEIWVVPSGELTGAMSLGVFADPARATLFRNQLLERGVKAEIKERYKIESRPFVRIKGDQKIPKRLAEGMTSSNCGKP